MSHRKNTASANPAVSPDVWRKVTVSGWTYLNPDGSMSAVPCEWLLKDYIDCIKNGEPVPEVVADFMAHIADQLLRHNDVRDLLQLKRDKHRPKDIDRQIEIAKRCVELDLQGTKLDAIYLKVREEFKSKFKKDGEKSNRVEKIYQRWWVQAALELDVSPDSIPSKKKYFLKKLKTK